MQTLRIRSLTLVSSVIAISIALVSSVPDSYIHMYCSNGEISVPLKYCSKGIYSIETNWPITKGGKLPKSWDSVELTIVRAPSNFTNAVLNYLRKHGFSVTKEDISGFTILVRLIHYRLVHINTWVRFTLPNGTVITVTSTNKLIRIPSTEKVVIVGKNISDFNSPMYAIKFVDGIPVAATKIRVILANVTKKVVFVKDIASEIAMRLNTSVKKIRELGIPTEIRKVLIIKRYILRADNPKVLTLGSYNLESLIGSIVYELHSQITLAGMVFAESVAKAEAWFLEGAGALNVNDESYCASYQPFMFVERCDHDAYIEPNGGIHVYSYGKFVYVTIPPLFQITYCAGAEIFTNDIGKVTQKGTRVCW